MAYSGQGAGFNPHAPRTPAPKGFDPHAPRAEQGIIPPATSKIAAVASPVIFSGPYQAPPPGREALNRNVQQQRK